MLNNDTVEPDRLALLLRKTWEDIRRKRSEIEELEEKLIALEQLEADMPPKESL